MSKWFNVFSADNNSYSLLYNYLFLARISFYTEGR